MAKKPTPAPKAAAPAPKTPSKFSSAPIGKAASPSPASVSTPVRNSAVPKPQAAPKPAITHDAIAKRAYEISQSPACGSEHDNWIRAERELRGA